MRGLPADLPASVFVVLHHPPNAPTVLAQILGRAAPIPAVMAEDGAPIERGMIYVAPPDHHLLLRYGTMHLSRGPRENRHRPAIDPLFRTAARVYGPRVIGVVCSGALDDGTFGLSEIKLRDGMTIVQSPEDALFASMPENALAAVHVDYTLPAAEIGGMIGSLVGRPDAPAAGDVMTEDEKREIDIETPGPELVEEGIQPGKPAVYGCPECGGALWEMHEGELIHFRCRIGHAYSSESLADAQGENLEAALWTALRALSERESLLRRLANRARTTGHDQAARRFEEQALEMVERTECVRTALDGWTRALQRGHQIAHLLPAAAHPRMQHLHLRHGGAGVLQPPLRADELLGETQVFLQKAAELLGLRACARVRGFQSGPLLNLVPGPPKHLRQRHLQCIGQERQRRQRRHAILAPLQDRDPFLDVSYPPRELFLRQPQLTPALADEATHLLQ
jgi:two-component system chemotaxis response regulator CheB